MSNRLLLKSSGTAEAVPDFDDLELAELVINTRNGKIFCKTYDGATYAIVDLTLSSPDEIIASGPGILGRTASGTGPAALLSGADVVPLLPAATSSADGKMTAAQATKLDNMWVVWDEECFAPEFTSISYKFSSKYENGGTLTYTGGRGVYNSGSAPYIAVFNSGGMRFMDCAAKAVFKLENSAASFICAFRYDNGANGDMYRVRITPGSPGTIYLERLDAWSPTTLDSASVEISLNTDYTVTTKAIGSALSAEVNGVTVSAVSSNYKAGTIELHIYLDTASTQGGSFGYYGIYTPAKTL